MLGLDNPIHIVFLLIVLLLVFGAKRRPEMGRSLGSGMRGFKESLSGEHPELTAPAQQPTTPAPQASATSPIAASGQEAVEEPKAPLAA
ncbi:MAG: twin-arginine translocase TatA/TatE family subunit [Solirubrobacteraceae bacterium]